MIRQEDKRIRVIVGHYGSGKTEFAVNYALKLAAEKKKTALVDLDIANPYFRSRERQALLEDRGITVYSNTFGRDITADLPAITASIKAPLEDRQCQTVVDAGGDESGAKVLIQFGEYFHQDCDVFFIINGNRPETQRIEGALGHLRKVEAVTGFPVSGLVNNTHLLRETTAADILKGHHLCRQLSEQLGIPLIYDCCPEWLMAELRNETAHLQDVRLFPLHLYMRERWLDR